MMINPLQSSRHSRAGENPEGRCKRGPSPEKVALKNGNALRP